MRRLSTSPKYKEDNTEDLRLLRTIVGDKTSELWKKSANYFTLKFKEPLLEAKASR